MGLPASTGKAPRRQRYEKQVLIVFDCDRTREACDRLAAQGLLGSAIGALIEDAVNGRRSKKKTLELWRNVNVYCD